MMRRTFAIFAVLLLSGLLPLAASASACASEPCCRSHRDCCNEETTCATPAPVPQVVIVAGTTAPAFVVAAEEPLRIIDVPQVAHVDRYRDVGSPPTSRRLASLSILLI
jgi:hypothetical protein